jgi:CRISPR-associated protein Cmr1
MRQPSHPAPTISQPEYRGMIQQRREYQLITPLFGGGVKPGEADPVTVIRGTEIRGHLRFWWRACCGGQFDGHLARMKEAEDILWGAASTSDHLRVSQVQICTVINDQSRGQPFVVKDRQGQPLTNRRGQSIRVSDPNSPYGYAAFPLNDKPDATVREGVKFTLIMTFPVTHKKEIEAALWAWETFGGIGGRTRRGFGALRCIKVNNEAVELSEATQVADIIQQRLEDYEISGTWPDNVPHLTQSPSFKVTRPYPNADAAWKYLIRKLKEFRQARDNNGRSLWPESRAIRYQFGRPAPQINKFPRAAFGLPIIFHFTSVGKGYVPPDTILKGPQSERLASRLILRPLACADNQAVGLALILEAPISPPGGIILKDAPNDPAVELTLTDNEAQAIQPLNGQTDVLQAFLEKL